jgi:predicted RNA-binding protein with TRAM domain
LSSEDGQPTGGENAEHSEAPQRQRFPSSYFKPKPVKIGEELEVTVTELSKKGDGVTRVQGYVIFIPNAKQGQQVKIKITAIRPNFAIGELLGSLSPAS